MPSVKIDPDLAHLVDDGRYAWTPGLGRTRTGPRERGFWEGRDQIHPPYFSRTPSYDSYRPDYAARSRNSVNQAVDQDAQQAEDHHSQRPTQRTPGFSETTDNKKQRNRSPGDARLNDPFSYADSRRSGDHLPSRRDMIDHQISLETTEDQRSFHHDDRHATAPRRQSIIKHEPDDDERLFFSDDISNDRLPANLSCNADRSSCNDSNNTGRGDSGYRSEESPSPSPPPEPIHRVPDFCKCPIGECEVRPQHLIDCRNLTFEWKRWESAQVDLDQLPEDVEPEAETFVDLATVELIITHLDNIDNAATPYQARAHIRLVRDWIRTVSLNSIHPGTEITILPRIQAFLSPTHIAIRNARHVPMHIVEELTIIANKWARGDFSVRPSRGLRRRGHFGRFWPDRDYDLRRSAAFFGHNGLVNGQMWATRSEMYRDGAHGMLIGGIHGGKAIGVYAVVMGYHNPSKGEYYADIDCGETIWYISTALQKQPWMGDDNIRDDPDELVHVDPDLATDGAQALIKSHETRIPVRVIRSFKAALIVPHRPRRGYRYDGLYRVVDYELLKADRQIYRFKMTRLDGREGEYAQGPLRSPGQGPRDGNLPERPTRRRRREERDGVGATSERETGA